MKFGAMEKVQDNEAVVLRLALPAPAAALRYIIATFVCFDLYDLLLAVLFFSFKKKK